jgi:hypothetical protein
MFEFVSKGYNYLFEMNRMYDDFMWKSLVHVPSFFFCQLSSEYNTQTRPRQDYDVMYAIFSCRTNEEEWRIGWNQAGVLHCQQAYSIYRTFFLSLCLKLMSVGTNLSFEIN